MTSQKIVAFVLAASLAAVPLCACAPGSSSQKDAQQEASVQSSSSASSEQEESVIAGGWAMPQDVVQALSPEDQERFDRAVATYNDAELTPVAVLATQLVSGTNYAYLCERSAEGNTSQTTWAVAVVYEDLQGNASITSVTDLDVTDVAPAKESDEQAMGAWEVISYDEAALAADVDAKLHDALGAYQDVALTPVTVLGTQVVAGTNYKVLCTGTPKADGSKQGLYVATVYADLEGNVSVSEVNKIDVTRYVDQ